MEKVIVLGASGGMGYSLVHELVGRGIEVIAFARNKVNLERLFGDLNGVTIITGDVLHLEDVVNACQGVDAIYQSVVVPYQQWQEKMPLLIRNVLEAARQVSAKLILVDNVYAYGKNPGHKVSEDQPKNPHTRKGEIRLQMEMMIKAAEKEGVSSLFVHLPDYYGPNAENTYLHSTLQAVVENKKASYVGKQDVKREFIFTPDGARAIVELSLRDSAYGENWNIPATRVISGEEILAIVRKITGYEKKVGTVTKGMISFLGIFNPFMREVVEMMYLTEDPVVLSGDKYEARIGALPMTSYEEGLRQTIEYMKSKSRVAAM